MEDIKRRIFPQAPKFNRSVPFKDAVPLEERAASLARYVHRQAHPIPGESLCKAVGMSPRTLTRVVKVAREKNWIGVQYGPAGGYCAGAVAPPDLEETKAA